MTNKELAEQYVKDAEEVLLGLIGRINKRNGSNTGFATAMDTKGEFIIAVATLASGMMLANK